MRRMALMVGIACVIGSMHALEANAQEDEFEVTLDAVLDDVSDIDGVIMTVIEEEHGDRESDELHENDDEPFGGRAHDELVDHDEREADELDDGQFDDYDDGEIPEEEHHDEPSMDEPDID
ncbi:MAG: hypothetical protein HKN84_02285 [Gammaproteobacteria bacterium]|nr:hypothetical protein [Gammaproteobacteria bacterium]